MHLPKYEYFAPTSIKDACSLLSNYKGEARILAGGTDLLVKMKNRRLVPFYIISIKNIPKLDYIRYDEEEGLKIGALTTLEAIKTSSIVRQRFGILAQAAGMVGSVAIRNVGTMGGNLCNAAPSAEMATPLIALAAKVKITGPAGERVVMVEEFFTGPGETILQTGEILTEINVPNLITGSRGLYLKHSLRPMEIAVVGVGVVVTLDEEVCKDVKIALGAVAPTPIRAKKAEDVIKGYEPTEELIEQAAVIASDESRPIDDIRSSAKHRRNMVNILTAHAIEQVVKEVRVGV